MSKSNVFDFKSKQLEMVDEGRATLSKQEILENIIATLQEADIDELVVSYFTSDGDFRAHSNVGDGGSILWLLKQTELGVLGV
jgi:ribosomal protein S24E